MAESESSFEGPADRFELDELEQLVKTQREMLQGLRKQLGCATQSNDHAQKKASYAVQLAQTLQVRAQQAEVDNVRLKAEVASLKNKSVSHSRGGSCRIESRGRHRTVVNAQGHEECLYFNNKAQHEECVYFFSSRAARGRHEECLYFSRVQGHEECLYFSSKSHGPRKQHLLGRFV